MAERRPELIAEVKTASPFGWRSERSWDELFEIAAAAGDWISVHTDPRWEGSFELLGRARSRTSKPLLAKGIHAQDDDVRRAFDAGADYVLVVGRVPELPAAELKRCLIEANTVADLTALPAGIKAVWNSRDLKTGGTKPETFAQARAVRDGWLCQASHIAVPDDVAPRADAILVGTHLPEFAAAWRQREEPT